MLRYHSFSCCWGQMTSDGSIWVEFGLIDFTVNWNLISRSISNIFATDDGVTLIRWWNEMTFSPQTNDRSTKSAERYAELVTNVAVYSSSRLFELIFNLFSLFSDEFYLWGQRIHVSIWEFFSIFLCAIFHPGLDLKTIPHHHHRCRWVERIFIFTFIIVRRLFFIRKCFRR